MKIPWAKPYIEKEEFDEVKKVFDKGWLAMGPKTMLFQEALRKLVKSKYAVAVNSGTAALDLALKLVGVCHGDEVIIPAMTYIATANAVLYQHAKPVFVDIDRNSFVIDPTDLERKITNRTKCVIAVDYAGQSSDYDLIKKICRRKNIALVEDGAPGLGGRYKTKALCSMGDISITSFHMAKIFTSVEGGMIFTGNKLYAKKARILRSQGEDPDKKYFHPYVGHNYRMSDLHAAVGIAQIRRFGKVLYFRAKSAEYYTKNLKNIENIKTPYVNSYNRHAWFLYPILVEKRDKIRRYLSKKGIQTNVSWPLPIYKQKPYLKYAGKRCVNAEYVTKRILCLPLYYNITKKEQKFVVEKLKEAVAI